MLGNNSIPNNSITVISGEIDAGKTTRMEAIYREINRGDGFLSKKVFTTAGEFIGYELVRLSTSEKIPLAYKKEFIPGVFDEIYCRGPFHFSREAFEWAEKVIDEILEQEITPIFIDEIGPLELQDQGFCDVLKKVLNYGEYSKDIYLVVRNRCVHDVMDKFGIGDAVRVEV